MIFGIIGILVAIGSILYARWYMKRQWENLEHVLRFSSTEIKANSYELADTMNGKVAHMVRKLYESLEIEYVQADEEKEQVKSYVADLSHQLKTPLANVKLYTELLKEESLADEERADFIMRLSAETDKLQWLLKALTRITRLEIGAIDFEVKRQSLSDTIELAASSVKGLLNEKNMELEIKPFTDCEVSHNYKWSAESLTNLLENAIKYSENGSKINISVEPMDLYIRVNITDHGIGIESSDYNDIFKRFYRGKNVENMPGSGLGLYLSQLIMNKQDGYIVVRSKINEGSTFHVYFKR
ncbi:sensor protein resE [Lachnospiraceae bacterium KM106-2]|nr:sensor protein resE [Lachnospiraceae bacterium KM106-2]